MKFLLTGDWHLRTTNPRYRIDDFQQSQFNKIKWILLQAKLHRATILNSGDFFDTPKVSYEITNRYLELLKKHPLPIFVCAGQHDQRYHTSDTINTPLHTMAASGVLSTKSTDQIQICSWGDSIPKEGKEILVIHKSITEKAPPFFLEDAVSADIMLRNYSNYKYIVSGDYHVPHVTKKDDRYLINVGSIMRQSKDQQDFKPRVYILDTEKNTVKHLFIPIKSPGKVFDMDRVDREDTKDKKILDEFIQNIKVKTNRPDFKKVLFDVIEQAKPEQEVKKIISNILEVL